MAPIIIKHVVSFTSQDQKNGVDNVCESSGFGRPWLCAKQDRSGVLKAELQLERTSTIGFIDVGNFGSAFIQVDVGRSSWSTDHPFVTLLPTATLMSPADSRKGNGRQSVRMFKKADFIPETAEESWDRLRVTCTQPFNKHSQFGLSFLRLQTAEEHPENLSGNQEGTNTPDQGTPDKIQSVKEWLSSPAMQHTFFGQNTGDGSPVESQSNHGSMSRAERMVTAAQSVRRSLHVSPHNTLTSSPYQKEAKNPAGAHLNGNINPGRKPRTQCQRRRSKPRQEQTSSMSTLRSATCHNSTVKRSQVGITTRTGTRTDSPVKAHELSHTSNSPDSPETVCPLCGVSFSPLYLPFHASSCLDSGSAGFSENLATDVVTSLPSPSDFGISRDDLTVLCPLCSVAFPTDCIEQHASFCGETIWVD